ncbi:MAG: phosphate ABC transporter permease subunit PstC [Thermoplasmata archaeon]
MARASPAVSRGERAVPATEEIEATRARSLAQRVRLLRWLGRGFHAGTSAVAVGVLLLVAVLVAVLGRGAWLSIGRFGPSFLTGTTWDAVHNVYGAGPAIAGTLLTSGLALVIAVPISLGVAIFLSEAAPPWLRRPLATVIDLSAAVPSVVYGFWAYIVLVPLMRSTIEPGLGSLTGGAFPFSPTTPGYDVLTATLVLTVMIIPTIAAVSRESLRAVPRIHRESALSLGATRWEATRMGVLPPARSGIAAGVMLGLGRALGETIAVAMVIGNIYILPGTLFSPGATLASTIVNTFPDAQPGLNRSAIIELALILFVITVAVNVVARGLLWRFGARDGAERPARRRRFPLRSSVHDRAPVVPLDGRAGPEAGASAASAGPPSEEVGWRHRVLEGAPRRIFRRRVVQWVLIALTATCVVLALVPLASVIYTAASYGGSAVVHPSFYTSMNPLGCNPKPGVSCSQGGIGPQIQGTLIMLGLGALIAVPVGLFAGIYLAEYGRNRFAQLVSFLSDVMTGVPTIVLGVFVFAIFLYVDHDAAISALCGGVALGVLMIPIAIRATEEALRAVPSSLRESALALGFPKHRVTLRVVLGCARGGLVTGMLLAVSRAAGDTAALLLTAGAGSRFWFQNLTSPTAAMTPFIYNNFGSQYLNLQTDAWGAALVLLAMMLAINLGARLAVPGAEEAAEAG